MNWNYWSYEKVVIKKMFTEKNQFNLPCLNQRWGESMKQPIFFYFNNTTFNTDELLFDEIVLFIKELMKIIMNEL